MPSWQSVKEEDQSPSMREERRDCFIAITWTRTSLTLTHALQYGGYQKASSRFLTEMGVTPHDASNAAKTSSSLSPVAVSPSFYCASVPLFRFGRPDEPACFGWAAARLLFGTLTLATPRWTAAMSASAYGSSS